MKKYSNLTSTLFKLIVIVLVLFLAYRLIQYYSPSPAEVVVERNQNDEYKDWYMIRRFEIFMSRRVISRNSFNELPSDAYDIDCHITLIPITNLINGRPVVSFIRNEDCTYTINEWREYAQSRSYGGFSDSLIEPETREINQCVELSPNIGCQRSILETHFRVWFRVWDGDEYRNYLSCDVHHDEWLSGYDLGEQYMIDQTRHDRWLCETLRRR